MSLQAAKAIDGLDAIDRFHKRYPEQPAPFRKDHGGL